MADKVEVRCSENIWRNGAYHASRCSNKGILQYEGRWYCKTHFPPNVQKKRDKRDATWKAEWDSGRQRDRDAKAKQAELVRKAAAYDRLVAWLETGWGTGLPAWPRWRRADQKDS